MTSSLLSSSMIFSFSRIFSISLGYIYSSIPIDEFTFFLILSRISLLYTASTIKTNQMKSYGNMELDDQSSDSYASDDTSESDFEFDFDELELSDDDSNVYPEELNSMNESSITDSGFTSISLKELTPVSVFRKFFDEEILKLITDLCERKKTKQQSEKK